MYVPSPWQEELPLPDDILLLDGSGVDTTNCNKEEKVSSSINFQHQTSCPKERFPSMYFYMPVPQAAKARTEC